MSQRFEQFGKYLLLEKLASGGMAEVFLARSQAAGGISKFVAIKRILPQFAESQEFIEMFKAEAKIAVNLSHGNIVSIYDFGVQGGQFYLVMDYVEGRNLRQILNKMKKSQARFSVDQVIYIVREVAAGLDHAHRCHDGTTGKPLNITHRDMSPQNIMITFEGEIKIVDFGIAKAESQLETTRAGTLKGKFGYMSPEQAEGQPVDLRTDIFSLGIVLWELLANERLFAANSEMNTLRKIRDCQVPSLRKLNPSVPSELERITMKALTKDRNLRYQTAAALHRDLNRFLNRHYPEFSTQDFASAIKGLFSEEIYSIRQRLIDYAKLPTSEDAPSESPVAASSEPTGVHGETSLSQASLASSSSDSGFDMQSKSDSISSSIVSSSEVTLPPGGGDTADATRVSTFNDMRPSLSSPNGNLKIESTEGSFKAGMRAKANIRTPRYIDSDNSRWLSTFLTILFIFAAYIISAKKFELMRPVVIVTDPLLRPIHQIFGINQSAEPSSEAPRLETPPAPPPTQANLNPNPRPSATPAQESNQRDVHAYDGTDLSQLDHPSPREPDVFEGLVIASVPSGAEVLIDGKSTGRTTPVKLLVPSNRPFHLQIRRSGYIDYVVEGAEYKSLPSGRITATLQQALIGFIDIDVRPPSPVKIFVAGENLREQQLPIEKYAIPAEIDVTVRAEDPYRNTYVERVIKVEKGSRQLVVLDMRQARPKETRLPSRIPNQALPKGPASELPKPQR